MICKHRVKNSFRKSFDANYKEEAVIQQEMAELIVEKLHEMKPSFRSVFELGCGTGILTSKLIKNFKPEILFLNDLTDTSQLISNLPQSCNFITGDAEAIEYPRQMNLIASNAVVQWFDSLAAHVNKVHQSLAPGGIFAFSTFSPDNLYEIRQLTGKGLNYPSMEKVQKIILSKGFYLRFCQQYQRILYFETPTKVLRHLQKTGVNALGSKAWNKSRLQQFNSDYLQQFSKPAGLSLTYSPIIIIAQKLENCHEET